VNSGQEESILDPTSVLLLPFPQIMLCYLLYTALCMCSALGPGVVPLGGAGEFAILSKTGITNVPPSSITGHIGVSPIAATGITGFALNADSTTQFATSPQVIGKVYAADYTVPTPDLLTGAILDLQAAYVDVAGRAHPDESELAGGRIGGLTLVPGLYKWTSDVFIDSDLYLNGTSTDTWIMHTSGNVRIAAHQKIVCQGGAAVANIVWSSAGVVSVEAGAHLEGVILAAEQVIFITGSSLNGRALSQTGVILQAATIVSQQNSQQKAEKAEEDPSKPSSEEDEDSEPGLFFLLALMGLLLLSLFFVVRPPPPGSTPIAISGLSTPTTIHVIPGGSSPARGVKVERE
jgi:hypothetical protein